MSSKQYDVIVLGSGSAGYQVAMRAKEAGKSVAVVNRGDFGGTCSSKGCIPKKLLAGTAELVDEVERLQKLGIFDATPKPNWAKMIAFKRTFTSGIAENSLKGLQDAGIDTYAGSPAFTGKQTLTINDETLEAEKILIAVGAEPTKLPIDGFEHMIMSDEYLELDELPESMIFVGGGYISFEFAHIAARFGSKVTILQNDDRPLPMFDKDMVDSLLEASAEAGIKVVMNQLVSKIEKDGDAFAVSVKDGESFKAASVVHGAGRAPAISELNLEAAGVDYGRRGVVVDEYLQSVSNPHVYAAGDAADAGPPLSPVAGTQGTIVAQTILGEKIKQPSYESTPSVLFASPQVSSVGMTVAEAEKNPDAYNIAVNDTSGWFMAKRRAQKFSKSKVITEKETNIVKGAHLVGDDAGELINLFALAVELELTTDDLRKPIMAFPTTVDDSRHMLG